MDYKWNTLLELLVIAVVFDPTKKQETDRQYDMGQP